MLIPLLVVSQIVTSHDKLKKLQVEMSTLNPLIRPCSHSPCLKQVAYLTMISLTEVFQNLSAQFGHFLTTVRPPTHVHVLISSQ